MLYEWYISFSWCISSCRPFFQIYLILFIKTSSGFNWTHDHFKWYNWLNWCISLCCSCFRYQFILLIYASSGFILTKSEEENKWKFMYFIYTCVAFPRKFPYKWLNFWRYIYRKMLNITIKVKLSRRKRYNCQKLLKFEIDRGARAS